jgi:hypothetical protein
VYLFNWFGLPEDATERLSLLDQIGDEATLRRVDKRFQPDNGCDFSYCSYTVAPQQFPVGLVHGTPVELFVGDDVRGAAEDGTLDSMELRIEVAHMHVSEGIDVLINGVRVPPTEVRRTGETEFKVNPGAPLLEQGANKIVVLPGKGSVGRVSSKVNWMELSVVYR